MNKAIKLVMTGLLVSANMLAQETVDFAAAQKRSGKYPTGNRR